MTPLHPDAPPRKRILIVDDEASMVDVLQKLLVRAGYETGVAANGTMGLQTFQESRWDVVFTDYQMPGLNGEELAAVIRTSHPTAYIVLITGMPLHFPSPTLFDSIIRKPFQMSQIFSAIRASNVSGPLFSRNQPV